MKKTLFLAAMELATVALALGQQPVCTQQALATNGLPGFFEGTLAASATLRSAFTPMAKLEVMEKLFRFKDEPVMGVEASVTQLAEGYYLEWDVVKFREDAIVFLMESVDGTREKAFSVWCADLASGLSEWTKQYNAFASRRTLDTALVEQVLAALRGVVGQRDMEGWFRLEDQLQGRVKVVPPYVRARTRTRAKSGAMVDVMLQQLAVQKSTGRYLCTKSITRSFCYSLYCFESSMGPAVVAVFYEELAGKPVIVEVDFHAGHSVLPFAQDIGGRTEAAARNHTSSLRP